MGPELQDKRASSSYLVWENGQARVLVDAGGGSALRFGESGAQMSQLDVLLFSHFHVDHSGDFAALIKSSWFEDRKRALPIYGPPGNDFMPSTTEFVSDLFGDKHGAYRYLSELLGPGQGGSYQMQPHTVIASAAPVAVFHSGDVTASAVRVVHGGVPALAWRVEIGGRGIVFSGDTNGDGEGLVRLAIAGGLVHCAQCRTGGSGWGGEAVAYASVGDRANRRGRSGQAAGSVTSDAADVGEGGSDTGRDSETVFRAGGVC